MNYDVDSYYRSAMKVRPALFPSSLTPLLPLEYPSFSPIFVSGHPFRGPSLLVQGIFLEETNPSMFNLAVHISYKHSSSSPFCPFLSGWNRCPRRQGGIDEEAATSGAS